MNQDPLNSAFATSGAIAAHFAGQCLALDLAQAQPLLMQSWPTAEQPISGLDVSHNDAALQVSRGERYAVARGIAVMPLRGILTPDSAILERYLGWATYQGIEAASAELAANDDVSAVVVDANSPGGLVVGLEAGAMAIAKLAKVKPVHVLINPSAASAAYWIASQGSTIAMTPGAEVGSIGTTVTSAWPVQPGASGAQYGIHVSSHARGKRPDPTDETGQAEIARRLDQSEARFHAAVAAGRGIELSELPAKLSVTDDVADGGVMYDAADAMSRGLADTTETRADFYERMFATYAPKPVASSGRAMAVGAKAQAEAAQARASI